MGRFIEGADRRQATLLPEAIEDYVGEENPVRVIDAFVQILDLAALGFDETCVDFTPVRGNRGAKSAPVVISLIGCERERTASDPKPTSPIEIALSEAACGGC
jgi:hypothetical protein